jgi:hypothetical protein
VDVGVAVRVNVIVAAFDVVVGVSSVVEVSIAV